MTRPKLYEVDSRGINKFLRRDLGPWDARRRRDVPQWVAVGFVMAMAFVIGLAVGLMF